MAFLKPVRPNMKQPPAKKKTPSVSFQGDMLHCGLILPGQTQLQRMPCPIKSAAMDLVSPITAALEVL